MGASDEGRRCGKLEQLIEAILKWLKQAGFAAVRRLPEGVFPALTDTVVAVGIRKAEAKDAGLYSYLGVLETDGKPVSLYGKRLEAEISMEALCPEEQGAKRCMQAADALVTKLSGGVPGLTISRICAEECRFAADAECYSCKVTAHALAYVYALANEEETEFTDFILKGEVQ